MRADDARRGHGEIFHPGDALTVPEDPGATLRPGDAPWLKLSEMVDAAAAPTRSTTAAQRKGVAGVENWLKLAAEPVCGMFALLEPGTCVDLWRTHPSGRQLAVTDGVLRIVIDEYEA
jgi:hypothetical protein